MPLLRGPLRSCWPHVQAHWPRIATVPHRRPPATCLSTHRALSSPPTPSHPPHTHAQDFLAPEMQKAGYTAVFKKKTAELYTRSA